MIQECICVYVCSIEGSKKSILILRCRVQVQYISRPVTVGDFRSESIRKILSSIPRILNQKKGIPKILSKYLIVIG